MEAPLNWYRFLEQNLTFERLCVDGKSKHDSKCGYAKTSAGISLEYHISLSISYRIPNTEYNVFVVPKDRGQGWNKIDYTRTISQTDLEDFDTVLFNRSQTNDTNIATLDKINQPMIGLFLSKTSNQLYVLFRDLNSIRYCLIEEVSEEKSVFLHQLIV